ncbi:MAG: rhamnulokinase family protein [Planctomycetota bacterium]
MSEHAYIACDLGAESGRVFRGRLADGVLTISEAHRFANGGIHVAGSVRWDLPRIIDELRVGIRAAATHGRIDSLSTDSWACDYVLIDRQGATLSLPYHYRDARGAESSRCVSALVPHEQLYHETGIQSMPFNTINQLHWDVTHRPELISTSDRLLLIADWCNYKFSGIAVAEESLASTTQLYRTHDHRWSADLIHRVGLPGHLLPRVVPSATVLGPAVAELGVGDARVIAGCSHDTAAAIAAVPASGTNWAYLSCGTWSLLGIETTQPMLSSDATYTNELGLGGSVRCLSIIVGLWVLQECRRSWRANGTALSYADVTKLADAAPPLVSIIDLRDPRFAQTGDMPALIQSACRAAQQPVPETIGAIARCVLESLAFSYRRSLGALEQLSGRKLTRLHVVGGGVHNRLLMQLTADATGREVIAGPVEATAIGNLLIQGLALGHIHSHAELRNIVRSSFPCETYQPRQTTAWDQAVRYLEQSPHKATCKTMKQDTP